VAAVNEAQHLAGLQITGMLDVLIGFVKRLHTGGPGQQMSLAQQASFLHDLAKLRHTSVTIPELLRVFRKEVDHGSSLSHACTHMLRLRLLAFYSASKIDNQNPHTHVFTRHMVVTVYGSSWHYVCSA
jgi:hypothetical protein